LGLTWQHADMNIQLLALLAAALLTLSAAFQIGLAAGAPWGAVAYGGRAISGSRAVPRAYRLGSSVAALVLLGAMWVVLASVDIVSRGAVPSAALTAMLWCLVPLFVLNTIGNSRGLHPVERWGASTLTATLAVLCALIAAR
jgi:hypothetical protein